MNIKMTYKPIPTSFHAPIVLHSMFFVVPILSSRISKFSNLLHDGLSFVAKIRIKNHRLQHIEHLNHQAADGIHKLIFVRRVSVFLVRHFCRNVLVIQRVKLQYAGKYSSSGTVNSYTFKISPLNFSCRSSHLQVLPSFFLSPRCCSL